MNFTLPVVHLLLLIIFAGGLQLCATIAKMFSIKNWEMIYWLMRYIAVIVIGSIGCQILLSLGAALAMPLIDEQLIIADSWFGFEWMSYFLWLIEQPQLMAFLDFTYNSMLAEIFLVLVLLAINKRYIAMERFVNAYLLALVITLIIASLWASIGAYVYYDIDLAQFGVSPPAARIHETQLLALRHGELSHFPLIMKGIVSFPSFHAATALLCIWALWPFTPLRVPSLMLNISMVVATLSGGGHWLVDILASFIIVPVAIRLSYCLIKDNIAVKSNT